MSQSAEKPRAAGRAWPPVVIPSLVLLAAAAVSVALACKGSAWALETVAAHGLGCLTGLALLSAVACSRMFGRPALLALHAGFALVLGGWVVNKVAGGKEGILTLAEPELLKQYQWMVQRHGWTNAGSVDGEFNYVLDRFEIKYTPNGEIDQYTSYGRIVGEEEELQGEGDKAQGEKAEISVNHPLVRNGWWVYQSSYQQMPNPYTGEVARNPRTGEPFYFTVLHCVKDVGLPFAAFGGVLLLLGAFGLAVGRDKRAPSRGARQARPLPRDGLPRERSRLSRPYVWTVRALYGLAFLGAVAMLVHRGFAAGHPPMQNMYEFLICTAALIPALTFVSARWDRQDTLLVDSLLLAIVLVPVGFFMDGSVKHLMPALQSPFFVPHVGAYVIGYVLLVRAALGAGRRLVGLGFFLLTLGLVLGAAWGKVCWGHWWQFDPKEMWSLATWLLYAAYFHLRPRLSPRADRAFLIAGALMVVLTLTWINLSRLFSGMHSYA